MRTFLLSFVHSAPLWLQHTGFVIASTCQRPYSDLFFMNLVGYLGSWSDLTANIVVPIWAIIDLSLTLGWPYQMRRLREAYSLKKRTPKDRVVVNPPFTSRGTSACVQHATHPMPLRYFRSIF